MAGDLDATDGPLWERNRMETYLMELGERAVAFLNGGIDRNQPDARYLAGWTVEDWRFRVLMAR